MQSYRRTEDNRTEGISRSKRWSNGKKNVAFPRHLSCFLGNILIIRPAILSLSSTRFCHSSPVINSTPEKNVQRRELGYGLHF